MSEYVEDRLAQRLRALEPRVDAGDLSRRALAGRRGSPRSRRRLAIAAAVVPLVLIFSASLASYYAPVFATALADAPIAGSVTGWMLRSVGLADLPHRVSSFGDASESSGYHVELVGGYADACRTILFLRATPAAQISFQRRAGQELVLSDQFGQHYRYTASIANAETGETAIIAEPLSGLSTLVGARLTLSFDTIEVGIGPSQHEITGSWQLHGTLALNEGRDLPLPTAGRVGDMRVTFTQLRAMPGALMVEMRLEPAGLDLQKVIPDGGKGRMAFTVRIVDAHGKDMPMLQGQYGSQSAGAFVGRWIWQVDTPGVYELRIAYEGIGTVVREVNIQ